MVVIKRIADVNFGPGWFAGDVGGRRDLGPELLHCVRGKIALGAFCQHNCRVAFIIVPLFGIKEPLDLAKWADYI
jgi:hypothetical protein